MLQRPGMEAARAADAPSDWQLDPDSSLILSDVHVGRGVRSQAADVQTTILKFSWPSTAASYADEHAAVLITPISQQRGYASDSTSGQCQGNALLWASHDANETALVGLGTPTPMKDIACDADGDLILSRRRPQSADRPDAALIVTISHHMATPLRDVGLQVSGSVTDRCRVALALRGQPGAHSFDLLRDLNLMRPTVSAHHIVVSYLPTHTVL